MYVVELWFPRRPLTYVGPFEDMAAAQAYANASSSTRTSCIPLGSPKVVV